MSITFDTFEDLRKELAKGQRLSNVELTPKLAEEILKQHKTNRIHRPPHVARLARAIREGWNNNPPGILMFYRDTFIMADGQHRCRAVKEAGKSIIVDMVPNVDSMVGHDEAAIRSVADHLVMEGIEDAHIVAKVAKALFSIDDTEGHAGNAAVLRHFKEHRAFCIECAAVAKQLTDGVIPSRLVLTAAQVAVGRARAIREFEANPQQVDEFYEMAINGGPNETAASDLYKALSGRPVKPVTSERIIQMTLIAFNLFQQNKRGRIENMRWKKKSTPKQRNLIPAATAINDAQPALA